MLEDIEFIYKCTNAIIFDNSIGIRMKKKVKYQNEEISERNSIRDKSPKKLDDKKSSEDEGEKQQIVENIEEEKTTQVDGPGTYSTTPYNPDDTVFTSFVLRDECFNLINS